MSHPLKFQDRLHRRVDRRRRGRLLRQPSYLPPIPRAPRVLRGSRPVRPRDHAGVRKHSGSGQPVVARLLARQPQPAQLRIRA